MCEQSKIIQKAGMAVPKVVVQAPIVQHDTIVEMVKQIVFYAPAIAQQSAPGQFVHVRVTGSYDPLLRRPLSIANVDAAAGTVTVIYRIVGPGTALLGALPVGSTVDCMGPLGTGFDLQCCRPLLVGGGMGLAPLVYLAQQLCPRPVEVLMGGRTKQELFWQDIFKQTCDKTHITTDDGSLGQRGMAVDLLPELLKSQRFDMIYTCGPRPMMEKVAQQAKLQGIPCQVSLEEHMACGVGACLSCTCAGSDGKRKKICTDGPVFWAGEVFA